MFSKDKSAGITLYKEFVLKENSEGENLDEIAKAFNVGAYSSVSSVVNRTGSQLRRDSRLRKSCQQICAVLSMSQAKTPNPYHAEIN